MVVDSKPSAQESGPTKKEKKGPLKQKQAGNGSDSWRPSKIRRLLGELAMNSLLKQAGGDPKWLGEALSQLKGSQIDPKHHDQVYQALSHLAVRGGF